MVGLSLCNNSGTFITAKPEVPTEQAQAIGPTEHEEMHQSLSGEENKEQTVSSLKLALEEANRQKQALQEEVQTFQQELGKLSCSQMQEYDQIIAAKDDEITELHALDMGILRDSLNTDTLDVSTTSERTNSFSKTDCQRAKQ